MDGAVVGEAKVRDAHTFQTDTSSTLEIPRYILCDASCSPILSALIGESLISVCYLSCRYFIRNHALLDLKPLLFLTVWVQSFVYSVILQSNAIVHIVYIPSLLCRMIDDNGK
jgi:hypothetical protein